VLLPKQKETLKQLNNHRFILYSGAFGAGKTLLLSNAVISKCLEHPGSRWLVGCQTYPMLRDTILKTFMDELDLYQTTLQTQGYANGLIKEWNKSTLTLQFYNGSEVLFRSCEDPSKFKSLNLDGFALDEPVDIEKDIFLMLQGRLREQHMPHPVGLLTGNPGPYTSWVYDAFFEHATPDYTVVETTTYDNSFLPRSYIQSMEQSYDEDYKRRYLQGKWGDFEGLIYKDFHHERHTGAYRSSVFKNYIAGYDDGYRNPACLLIGGVDGDNRLHVVHEYYRSDRTSDEITRDIQPIVKELNVRTIYCDPSGLNAIETFKRNSIRAVSADNKRLDVTGGISRLKSLFHRDMVFIDSSCVNLIKQLESYRYQKDRKTGGYNEEPVKKDDHAVDALRYLITDYQPDHHMVWPVARGWT